MPAPTLVVQTTYAELLERSAASSFSEAFPEDGNFTAKTIKGRRYWYFQAQTGNGRSQRYVGPETPELLKQIERHREIRDDERERRALVSTLVRSYGLPAPVSRIGEVVSALAKAGIFRLRSVLVGTVAYQCYPAMLGIKLPGALIQTTDVDIAQFTSISISTGDNTPPMLNVLQEVDKTFRESPHTAGGEFTTSYHARGGLRVDFLTPNVGPDSDEPQRLPALQTEAQPLRFLDFLIHEPEQAVVLHGSGVLVLVPAPERYAVHKLILSVRRRMGTAKSDKDLDQAHMLIAPLLEKRPRELTVVWEEAFARGPTWRQLLLDGMSRLESDSRDSLLKALKRMREILPGINLTFDGSVARYDSTREVVTFTGEALGHSIQCSVSREALEDYFGANNLDRAGRLEAFHKNRSEIEGMIRTMYLSWPVETASSVLLTTADVEKLRKRATHSNS
jgi:hypothetical protein